MVTIVLSGYYGFNNAGDELILDSLIYNFKKKNPKTSLIVLSKTPEYTQKIFNINSVNRDNLFEVYNAFKKSDLVVFSGGLYQDITSSLSLYYYLFQIILAKLLRKYVILQGVDFGPINRKFNDFILRITMNFVDEIIVRTEGSFKYLKTHKNIQLGKDMVFYSQYINSIKPENINTHIKIGLILRKLKYNNLNEIVNFCNIITTEFKNSEIVFIPFHLEQDIELCIEIIKKLEYKKTNIKRWNLSTDIFHILNNIDIIISQRLHGLIIGYILNKQIISVSEDVKIKFFMNDINKGNLVFKHFSECSKELLSVIQRNFLTS